MSECVYSQLWPILYAASHRGGATGTVGHGIEGMRHQAVWIIACADFDQSADPLSHRNQVSTLSSVSSWVDLNDTCHGSDQKTLTTLVATQDLQMKYRAMATREFSSIAS